jgi:hypothetical protein
MRFSATLLVPLIPLVVGDVIDPRGGCAALAVIAFGGGGPVIEPLLQ